MAKDKEEVKKPVVPTTTFEIEGKGEFKFNVAQFRIMGKNDNNAILATDALQDAELLLHLVDVRAGVIEKVKQTAEEAK